QADALLGPELEARAAAAADEQFQELAEQPGDRKSDRDERDRQHELVPVLGGRPDQGDPEDTQAFDMGRGRRGRGIVRRVEEVGDSLLHGRSTGRALRRFRYSSSRVTVTSSPAAMSAWRRTSFFTGRR